MPIGDMQDSLIIATATEHYSEWRRWGYDSINTSINRRLWLEVEQGEGPSVGEMILSNDLPDKRGIAYLGDSQ